MQRILQMYRFLIFFFIVVIYCISSTITTDNNQQYTICDTDECVIAAARVFNKLNLTVDPCDNFYQFACGGWIASNPTQLHITVFSQLYNKVLKNIKVILEDTQKPSDSIAIRYAREIYNMCMNNDISNSNGVAALDTFIQRFGTWPITLPLSEWNTDNVSWQEMIYKIHDNFFENSLFSVDVAIHSKKSDSHVIFITQPNIFFMYREIYEDFDNDIQKKEEYVKYIETVVQAFVENKKSDVTKTMITQDALNIVNFEIDLAKLTKTREEIMALGDKYTFPTLEKWQQTYDSFAKNSGKTKLNWLNLLQRIFGPLGITILSSDIIMTPIWPFFSNLVSLLEKTPIRTIANYVQWSFIREQVDYTTTQLEKFSNHIKKEFLGTEEPKSRWQTCVEVPNLNTAISHEYAKKYVQNANKENVKEIITDIADVVGKQIYASTWMDEQTKYVSIDKLDHTRYLVSTPEWYSNEAIDQLYENLTITSESGYLDNMLKMQVDERKRSLSKLTKPVDKEEWQFEPTTSEAFYIPNNNAILIPAAIMQDPIYDATRPMVMNYGAIGGIVGHEINHGFDNFGRHFDKDGNKVDWWTPETINNYKPITQCFVDQYNNYEVPGLEKVVYVKGKYAVGENIGDSAGFAAAFKAYKNRKTRLQLPDMRLQGLENYSEDQIFFMSLAQILCENISPKMASILLSDEHPRSETRVRGSLSNMADFSKAYKCSNDTKMNPVDKCNLWQ